MQWEPITDLPQDWKKIASSELPPLVTVWNEQAERLRASGEFQRFMDRLRREIAIETGIIEQLYNIDLGITRLLIERGIAVVWGIEFHPLKNWYFSSKVI